MLTEREAVRLTLMRGTVHLVTVRDALVLRPLVQVVIERVHNGAFGRRMGGADPRARGRRARAARRGGADRARAGRRLVERGIGEDVEAIGNAARVRVPLVQVPPRGVWGGRAGRGTRRSTRGPAASSRPSLRSTTSCSATCARSVRPR